MFFYMSENSSSAHVAPAVVGSLASLGASMWRGLSNMFDPTFAQVGSPLSDNIPVIGGLAIGIMGIGWSVYSAGPDRRSKVLTDAIDALQDQLKDKMVEIKEQDAVIRELRAERSKLHSDVGRLEGLLANAQARLSNNDARPFSSPSP